MTTKHCMDVSQFPTNHLGVFCQYFGPNRISKAHQNYEMTTSSVTQSLLTMSVSALCYGYLWTQPHSPTPPAVDSQLPDGGATSRAPHGSDAHPAMHVNEQCALAVGPFFPAHKWNLHSQHPLNVPEFNVTECHWGSASLNSSRRQRLISNPGRRFLLLETDLQTSHKTHDKAELSSLPPFPQQLSHWTQGRISTDLKTCCLILRQRLREWETLSLTQKACNELECHVRLKSGITESSSAFKGEESIVRTGLHSSQKSLKALAQPEGTRGCWLTPESAMSLYRWGQAKSRHLILSFQGLPRNHCRTPSHPAGLRNTHTKSRFENQQNSSELKSILLWSSHSLLEFPRSTQGISAAGNREISHGSWWNETSWKGERNRLAPSARS